MEKGSRNGKSNLSIRGLDFKSDYVSLYTEAKEVTAALCDDENFGLKMLAELGDEANPIKYKALITDQ